MAYANNSAKDDTGPLPKNRPLWMYERTLVRPPLMNGGFRGSHGRARPQQVIRLLPLNAKGVPQCGVSRRICLQTTPHRTFNRAIEIGGTWKHELFGIVSVRAVLEDSESPVVE